MGYLVSGYFFFLATPLHRAHGVCNHYWLKGTQSTEQVFLLANINMTAPDHSEIRHRSHALGILDISRKSDRQQAFDINDTKFHVFNVMDGCTNGATDKAIELAFRFVAEKLPADNKWQRVSVGNGVRYTPTYHCSAGAKTLASGMSILKKTNKEERKQHRQALEAIDGRVKKEGMAMYRNKYSVEAPFALLQTDGGTDLQDCHLDEKPCVIREHTGMAGYSAIIAATFAGSYLLIFPNVDMDISLTTYPGGLSTREETKEQGEGCRRKGKIIFIPFGWCLFFHHSILHAGGFRSLDDAPDGNGNLRFFYYILPGDTAAPIGNENAYENMKRKFNTDYASPLDYSQLKRVFFYK